MTRYAAAVLTALGVLSFGAVAHADEPLNDQQLLHLFPGTFQALVRGKFEVTVTVTRDGVIVGQASGLQDQGRWTLRGNQLCIVMPAMTRGRVECSAVIAENGWYKGRSVAFRKL